MTCDRPAVLPTTETLAVAGLAVLGTDRHAVRQGRGLAPDPSRRVPGAVPRAQDSRECFAYDDVPAQGLAPAVGAPTQRLEPVPGPTPVVAAVEGAGVWRIERLPRERGRPGWNVAHVHDGEDVDAGGFSTWTRR